MRVVELLGCHLLAWSSPWRGALWPFSFRPIRGGLYGDSLRLVGMLWAPCWSGCREHVINYNPTSMSFLNLERHRDYGYHILRCLSCLRCIMLAFRARGSGAWGFGVDRTGCIHLQWCKSSQCSSFMSVLLLEICHL